jgi:hypothetical protein
LIGGFSSIDWKNSGGWTIDPKCIVFSLTRKKHYARVNEQHNVHFNSGADYGPLIGCGGFYINKKQLCGNVN